MLVELTALLVEVIKLELEAVTVLVANAVEVDVERRAVDEVVGELLIED